MKIKYTVKERKLSSLEEAKRALAKLKEEFPENTYIRSLEFEDSNKFTWTNFQYNNPTITYIPQMTTGTPLLDMLVTTSVKY